MSFILFCYDAIFTSQATLQVNEYPLRDAQPDKDLRWRALEKQLNSFLTIFGKKTILNL